MGRRGVGRYRRKRKAEMKLMETQGSDMLTNVDEKRKQKRENKRREGR